MNLLVKVLGKQLVVFIVVIVAEVIVREVISHIMGETDYSLEDIDDDTFHENSLQRKHLNFKKRSLK